MNTSRLSHTYISHILQELLELSKTRQVLKHSRKLQVAIRYLTYINATLPIYFPLLAPGHHLHTSYPISSLSAVAYFHASIFVFSSFLTCPSSHQPLPPSLSLILPGGEHNLINHCWMRRPLLSGSR